MWLAVPGGRSSSDGGDSEEDCYHSALLSLFSTITQCLNHRRWISEVAKHLLHAWLKVRDDRTPGNGREYIQIIPISPSLFFSFSPSPQTHFSNQGYLLRFLAMIWTAPVQQGMEPGPVNHETLSRPGTSLSVSPATQANSLAVFSAYLSSLPSEAILALTTPLCPGTLTCMIRACW